jgi:serine/threonine protein kinase
LADLLKENGWYLSESNAGAFFVQMIDTLKYIKSKKVAHRDIKIENMIVNEQFQIKFADFDFASLSKDVEIQQIGTPI